MKNSNIIFLAFFIGLLFSCDRQRTSSRNYELGVERGELLLTRDKKEFIGISQYLNGSRVRLVTTDGSEVIVALDQNMGTVKEVFVIKSLIDTTSRKGVKKYISINEKCEVNIVDKRHE